MNNKLNQESNDLFIIWLNKKEESIWIKRALTDPSYNAYRSRDINKNNSNYKEVQTPLLTNTDLGTYGDGVIKLCLLDILFDNVVKLSEEKAKYESDKYFVEVVARHYDILKYIDKDFDDENLPNDYNYDNYQGNNNNKTKYIATAVEAVIGAIYKETNDLTEIIELIKTWMSFN